MSVSDGRDESVWDKVEAHIFVTVVSLMLRKRGVVGSWSLDVDVNVKSYGDRCTELRSC
jgi:hypothetical protein